MIGVKLLPPGQTPTDPLVYDAKRAIAEWQALQDRLAAMQE